MIETNWTSYYSKPYKTASWSRRITSRLLVNILTNHHISKPDIIEIGGGNSCFYDSISAAFFPNSYLVLDYNDLGCQLFNERVKKDGSGYPVAVKWNALEPDLSVIRKTPSLVMSFGLIEHFSPTDTAKIIKTHFDLLESGGIVLLTFPTPSFSYKIIRFFAELFHKWIFTDERPLKMAEVLGECKKHGDVLESVFNHKILLSQGIIVCRKK